MTTAAAVHFKKKCTARKHDSGAPTTIIKDFHCRPDLYSNRYDAIAPEAALKKFLKTFSYGEDRLNYDKDTGSLSRVKLVIILLLMMEETPVWGRDYSPQLVRTCRLLKKTRLT